MLARATKLATSTFVVTLAVTLVVALAIGGAFTVAASSHIPAPEDRVEAGFHFTDSQAPGEQTSLDMYSIPARSDQQPVPEGVEIRINYLEIQWPLDYDCEETDITVAGIDLGNDNPGMETDESLLENIFESGERDVTPADDPVDLGPGDKRHLLWVDFYSQDDLAGDPPHLNQDGTEDRLVLGLNDCVTTAEEPGWYRGTSYLNGTVVEVHDSDLEGEYSVGDEVENRVVAEWDYVCECENEEEAREQLGAPPDENGDTENGDDSQTATPVSTDDAQTATPENPDNDETATPESTDDVQTASPEDTDDGTTDTGGESTDTGSDETDTDDTAGNSADVAETDDGGAGDDTPSPGDGPGFGPVLAIGALLLGSLLARRR